MSRAKDIFSMVENIKQTSFNSKNTKKNENRSVSKRFGKSKRVNEDCNGWSNHATWTTVIHLDDEITDVLQEMADNYGSMAELEDNYEEFESRMSDFAMEIIGYDNYDTYAADLCSVSEIDWRNIFTVYARDIEFPEDDEDIEDE